MAWHPSPAEVWRCLLQRGIEALLPAQGAVPARPHPQRLGKWGLQRGVGVGVWCCFIPFLIPSSSPPIHTRAVCPSNKYLPACLQEIARHLSGNMCASFIKWIIDCLPLSPRFPLGVWVRNQADSYRLVHTSLSTPGCCRCLLLCEQSSV